MRRTTTTRAGSGPGIGQNTDSAAFRPSFDRPRIDYSVPPHTSDEVIERLSWLMDNSIPIGGGFRIGLDPLIGLIPGLGDLVSTLVSSAIVMHAHRAGIPRATLLRMVANVGIDAVLGAVPFVGDLFDFAFKANARNLQLYRESRAGVRDDRKDMAFLIALLVILGLIVSIPVLVIVWIARTLF